MGRRSEGRTGGGAERGAAFWIGTGSACISALVAVVAAFLALSQLDFAKQQNEIADRQSLATLVTDIAQQTLVLSTATPTQRVVVLQDRLADAEEAAALVNTLKEREPAIDDYEIGLAFEGSDEDYRALRSLERGAESKSAPHYRATSLRLASEILYSLGGAANARRAREDTALAYDAFEGHPDVSRVTLDKNHAFTDLFEIRRLTHIDCEQALASYRSAKRLIHEDHFVTDDPAVAAALKVAEPAVERCR